MSEPNIFEPKIVYLKFLKKKALDTYPETVSINFWLSPIFHPKSHLFAVSPVASLVAIVW